MNKVAVDQAAKDYWKLLWKEYGEALVRDIPRRLKAALVDNKKVASVNESAVVMPVAHARSEDGILIEGIYKDSTAKLMFHASLDKEGNVKELKSFELR